MCRSARQRSGSQTRFRPFLSCMLAKTRSTGAGSRSPPRLIADLFHMAGVHRIMSIDPPPGTQSKVFSMVPVDHLWYCPRRSDDLATKYDTSEMTVVSPDARRARLADMWTERSNSPPATIHKAAGPELARTPSPSTRSLGEAEEWVRHRSRFSDHIVVLSTSGS